MVRTYKCVRIIIKVSSFQECPLGEVPLEVEVSIAMHMNMQQIFSSKSKPTPAVQQWLSGYYITMATAYLA